MGEGGRRGSLRQPDWEHRSGPGRALTAVVVSLAALALVAAGGRGGGGAVLRAAPLLALAGVACWACFWRPRVLVDAAGVQMRNVLRTVDVPWAAIEVVDTRYAFSLQTPEGRWSAWAAPAPGRYAAHRAERGELRGLPATSFGAGRSIRPGDVPGSSSGAVALVVRRRWEDWQRSVEDGAPPGPGGVALRWHRRTAVALGALALLSAVALLVG